MKSIYRINCGSDEVYTDNEGNLWTADEDFAGGATALREKTLPFHNTAAPEVYRAERYNMEGYKLPVESGTYTIRLHFAETFDSNHQPGARSFDITINGKAVITSFDPYAAAGAFANPVIIEYAVCPAIDQIEIKCTEESTLSGIEIYKTDDATEVSIRQVTPAATPEEFFIGQRQKASPDVTTLKILFIGNSMCFFWAIPESLQAMLELGTTDLRIEPHRSLHGGKNLEFHYNETDALEKIKTGNFDLVVLQEYSKQLDEPDNFSTYAKKFDAAIRASGAKTLLYAQPGHHNATDQHRQSFMQQTNSIAKELHARVIPACETIRLCYAERPDITWHNADTVHMGMHGGYAVTCTFYAAFTDAPFPPPAVLAQQVAIGPTLATFIQEKAKQAITNIS